ncbi:hypothetical protein [Polyangium mundeleinium]|uniref:Lipoprotein n=1 Tax=Polyangium mundeleinium TaxID=2995306 RepID=A0ABT5EHW6_9BACT|nr:hypothetical protein [Polyangium mundeleinium]MDC0741099.1 hypothetical protein [Polyangium mundeleinium]
MPRVNVWIEGIVLACVTMSVVPLGCASNIESPPLKQTPTREGPHAPNKTIARLRDCVEEYGGDLGGEAFEFHYDVKVDEEGQVASVKSDVLHADFSGCTRAALRAMEVPPELFLTWMSQPLARGDRQKNAARGLVGDLVIVGVTIALAPLIIEAAGVTIVIMIGVAIAEDVVEAVRRRRTKKDECTDGYVDCMDSKLGDELGNNWNTTRCATCLEVCNNKGSWPSQVPVGEDLVPCGRLDPPGEIRRN